MHLCTAEALWSTLLLISCKKNDSKGNGDSYVFVRQISGIGIKGVLRNDFRDRQKSEKKIRQFSGGAKSHFLPTKSHFF